MRCRDNDTGRSYSRKMPEPSAEEKGAAELVWLAQGTRVIRMLRAGYTDAPPPTAPSSIGAHAGNCAATLEHLDVGAAHIVGHSSSCVIALQLALGRPDLVRSLVLSERPLIDQLAAPDDLTVLQQALRPVFATITDAVAAGDIPTAFHAFMNVTCGPDHAGVLAAALGPNALARAYPRRRLFLHRRAARTGAMAVRAAGRRAYRPTHPARPRRRQPTTDPSPHRTSRHRPTPRHHRNHRRREPSPAAEQPPPPRRHHQQPRGAKRPTHSSQRNRVTPTGSVPRTAFLTSRLASAAPTTRTSVDTGHSQNRRYRPRCDPASDARRGSTG